MNAVAEMNVLVDQIKPAVEQNRSVVVSGPMGSGKSTAVSLACNQLGFASKYLDASTLNLLDLVGVPGIEDARLISTQLKAVEVIVFDNLDRADNDVLDVIREIAELGSVNGKPLANLKHVVAVKGVEDLKDMVKHFDSHVGVNLF